MGGADTQASCASVGAEAKAQLLPSDIIWTIDTSGSMDATFPAIQQALIEFSNEVIAAGIDAHIVLLAGPGLCVPPPLGSGECGMGIGPIPIAPVGLPPMAPDTKAPNYLHINAPFGSNGGMGVLLDNFPMYKQMLRPDARVQLVMTEDGGPSISLCANVD